MSGKKPTKAKKAAPTGSPAGSGIAAGPPSHGPPSHGPHDPESKKRIVARLRSAEGHLRAVLNMVEADAYCIDTLRQTKAVVAAIHRIESLLLERHFEHCVTEAVASEDSSARQRVIAELLDVFEAARR